MGTDAIKQLILSRRAKFMAAALAGAGLASSGCDTRPVVCLDIVAPTGGAGGAVGGGGQAGTGGSSGGQQPGGNGGADAG